MDVIEREFNSGNLLEDILIIHLNNNIWFKASDICEILKYNDKDKVTRKYVKEHNKIKYKDLVKDIKFKLPYAKFK